MTAICLNTTSDCGDSGLRDRGTRTLIVALAVITVALVFSQQVWPQTKSPTKFNAQKTQPQIAQTQAAAVTEVSVPNLLWLPRESALKILSGSRLQPDVTDDNQQGSVVIEQPTTPGTKAPVYSKVRYTVGRPVLKLETSTHTTHVKKDVHFKVTLTPPARSANAESSPIVYEFVWKRGASVAGVARYF